MIATVDDTSALEQALEEVMVAYAKANPTSGEICKRAAKATPGGLVSSQLRPFRPARHVLTGRSMQARREMSSTSSRSPW